MTHTQRPVLGVISCNRTVETQAAQAVMTRYLVSAIKYADAAALLVPAMPELMHAKEVAPRLDGILLTGTPSNLDPQRYGQIVDDAPGPFDPARDEMHRRRERVCQRQQDLRPLGGQLGRGEVGTHAHNRELLLAALFVEGTRRPDEYKRIFQREDHPFANRLRGWKELLGERFGNHRDGRRHDAVLERDRPTSKQRRADCLQEIFADARDLRRYKLSSIRAGDTKDSVVEVNRHALGHSDRANAA